MFHMSMGFWEHVIRAAVVYIFLFILLRLVGKKHVGDLAPFDLVVLLILSETVQNAMIGDDNSLIGGLVSAATLIALVHAMGYVSSASKRAERFIEGTPKILVRHGHRRPDVMREQQVSISELVEAMRREGLTNITNIHAAVLENDGKISIIRRSETES
jgi:uncharacterized membrane protein YcaP (DUF421 family)